MGPVSYLSINHCSIHANDHLVEQHGLRKIASGKVREIYEIDDKTLLFVATDRISAYDVIMKNVCTLQKTTCHFLMLYRAFLAKDLFSHS